LIYPPRKAKQYVKKKEKGHILGGGVSGGREVAGKEGDTERAASIAIFSHVTPLIPWEKRINYDL